MYREFLVLVECIIAAAFYGLDATLMKLSNVQNPIVLAGIKLSGTLLFLIIVFRRLPKVRTNILYFLAICSAIFNCLFFIWALNLIPVADALLLFYSSMIWSCLWKWLAKIPISKLDIGTAITVFIGDAAILHHSHHYENYFGYTLGVLSGASFAGFLILTEQIKQKEVNNGWIHFDTFALALMIIILIFFSHVTVNKTLLPTTNQILFLLCDGALYGLAYYILFRALALALAPAHLVNTYLGAFEPFLGIVIAYLVLGEGIHGYVYFGLLTIVLPIVIRSVILHRNGI